MTEYYFYGLAAMGLVTTSLTFSAVRWFHTCKQPKENHKYIWPDRKLQVLAFLCSLVLLPYVYNPMSPTAWVLMKSYLVATWHFYCGLLLFCFFGTVKQWNQWKTTSWIAAIIVIIAMGPIVADAWIPGGILSESGSQMWNHVIMGVGLLMMGYAALAMWQVWQWMRQARDANYSNPDDFPMAYAHRVWIAPVLYAPVIWPAYILDSPRVMMVQNFLLAMSNVILLLNVLPVWRRKAILSSPGDDQTDEMTLGCECEELQSTAIEEQVAQTAIEIEAYVREQQAYLDSHLKIDDVVAHCQHGRTYVSLTFQRRFGSFAAYVNSLRLLHYEQYISDHPAETKEAAALASGFSGYNAYYRAKQKQERNR